MSLKYCNKLLVQSSYNLTSHKTKFIIPAIHDAQHCNIHTYNSLHYKQALKSCTTIHNTQLHTIITTSSIHTLINKSLSLLNSQQRYQTTSSSSNNTNNTTKTTSSVSASWSTNTANIQENINKLLQHYAKYKLRLKFYIRIASGITVLYVLFKFTMYIVDFFSTLNFLDVSQGMI